MCMPICLCMTVHSCLCVHLCACYVGVHAYMCACLCVPVCAYLYMPTCVCMPVFACLYVCMALCVHACVCRPVYSLIQSGEMEQEELVSIAWLDWVGFLLPHRTGATCASAATCRLSGAVMGLLERPAASAPNPSSAASSRIDWKVLIDLELKSKKTRVFLAGNYCLL